MPERQPLVVIIGGPNGAGKTTISREVLANTLGITEFVNADTIAAGLSGFNPEGAAFAAGRVMLNRMRELAATRTNFSFESTLSSRTFAPWLRSLHASGWEIHVLYVSLKSPSLAVARVRDRVRRGGHGVDALIIRRRFHRSVHNLFNLYLPLAHNWRIYDNSGLRLRLVAECTPPTAPDIHLSTTFNALRSLQMSQSKTKTKVTPKSRSAMTASELLRDGRAVDAAAKRAVRAAVAANNSPVRAVEKKSRHSSR